MFNVEFEMKRLIVIKLENGEDVLRGLEAEVKKAGILNGVILTGVGSTTSYHIHVVGDVKLPVPNLYFKDTGPFDIVNMQGHIIGGRVHAHISLADAIDGTQKGGHLEPGCKVLTFCAITIMETTEVGELDQC